MRLGAKQELFARQIPALFNKAFELGFDIRVGDAFRDPRAFGAMGEKGPYGNKYSCHKAKLAIDLNLFRDGVYLADTEDHRPLGEWWEAQHPDNCWGGRFNDGNHYSMTHEGIK